MRLFLGVRGDFSFSLGEAGDRRHPTEGIQASQIGTLRFRIQGLSFLKFGPSLQGTLWGPGHAASRPLYLQVTPLSPSFHSIYLGSLSLSPSPSPSPSLSLSLSLSPSLYYSLSPFSAQPARANPSRLLGRLHAVVEVFREDLRRSLGLQRRQRHEPKA